MVLDKINDAWEKFKAHMVESVTKIPEPTHECEMVVKIEKGKTSGTLIIPCAVYTLTHSIDLNPSLIKKATGERVKSFAVGEKIAYDPDIYDVKLSEAEKKKGVKLRELERCPNCGQKIVIAEVAETRYMSDPAITVRLSDPAPETLYIPVKFGIIDKEVRNWKIKAAIGTSLMAFSPLIGFLGGVDIISGLIMAVVSGVFLGYVGWIIYYQNTRVGLWYEKVKSSLKPIKR